jgi:thiamine pyrophosphate-dependent acetolactate synthase large subunit-like protein
VASAASAIVRQLERLGVEVVFGLPGVHTMEVYDALLESPIRHILARHEQGAGFMADGYSRASGKPGVCLLITGPGLTNAATALGTAWADSVPLLVITSQVPMGFRDQHKGYLHDLWNSHLFTSCIAKETRRVDSPSGLSQAVADLYHACQDGRPRPVHLEVPLDVLGAPIEEDAPREKPQEKWPSPSPERVFQAREMLQNARRPLVVVGGGAAGAASQVMALAETLECPVVSTTAGKGVLPEDHRLSLGARLQVPSMQRLLEEADTLLVVGSDLAPTDFWARVPAVKGSVVYVDIDAGNFSRNLFATVGLRGDAPRVLSELLRGLGQRHPDTFWTHRVSQALAESSRELPGIMGLPQGTGWARDCLSALREALPREGILCADMTTLAYIAVSEFPVYHPSRFLHPAGFGTLGYALPAALGAKIARPDLPVVALTGDGGFQFTMEELGTAVQERTGVPIIVVNNAGYGEIRRQQGRRHPGKTMAVDLVNPDFGLLASAYGMPYSSAVTPEQLGECLKEALCDPLPTLIELKAAVGV